MLRQAEWLALASEFRLMVILAAFIGIPILVTVLALISIESQSLRLRLNQRPDTPLRPGLLYLIKLIAFIGFTCFLDLRVIPTPFHRERAAVLGFDIVFILLVTGLTVGLRLSPLAWAWRTFLVSLIFILPFLVLILVLSLLAVVR